MLIKKYNLRHSLLHEFVAQIFVISIPCKYPTFKIVGIVYSMDIRPKQFYKVKMFYGRQILYYFSLLNVEMIIMQIQFHIICFCLVSLFQVSWLETPYSYWDVKNIIEGYRRPKSFRLITKILNIKYNTLIKTTADISTLIEPLTIILISFFYILIIN